MGELVRRLDYERRSKSKSLLIDNASGQRINKEYTPQVRAANDMEDRKREFYIQRNQMQIRNYMNRHDYERKQIERFKTELDVKSQYFDSEKFQMLQRAQSANARLQRGTGKATEITEIIPRHYYHNDTKSSSEMTPGDLKDESAVGTKQTSPVRPKSTDPRMLVFGVKRVPTKTKAPPRRSEDVQFLPQGVVIKRNSQSIKSKKSMSTSPSRIMSAPAAPRRRKISIENKHAAYVPKEVFRARPKRRGSRTSLSGSGVSGDSDEDDNESNTRSFRLLREAFKKLRTDTPNPAQERFTLIKNDHRKQSGELMVNVKQKFDDIIKGSTFTTVY